MTEEKKQKINFIANGFIKNGNKFLIVRRSTKSSGSGIWEFPGGHIEFGEHPDEAVAREVKEETGLELKPKCIHKIFSKWYEKENKKVHKVRMVYYFETSQENVELNPREHDDYRWITENELHEFLTGNHVKKSIKYL